MSIPLPPEPSDPPRPGDDDGLRAALQRAEDQLAAERAARLAAEERLREVTEQEAVEPSAPLSVFEEPQTQAKGGLAPDGSDPSVLPMALLGVAVVSGLVTFLALFNGRTVFGLLMLALTVMLGWIGAITWQPRTKVRVRRGIVYVEQGADKQRVDLASDALEVEVHGVPGDIDWQVRFIRSGLDSVVVHAGHVDPADFLARLREHRPDL